MNGFLVLPFNAETLAQKMFYLIEIPEIRRMGDESYRIVQEQFDVHKIILGVEV